MREREEVHTTKWPASWVLQGVLTLYLLYHEDEKGIKLQPAGWPVGDGGRSGKQVGRGCPWLGCEIARDQTKVDQARVGLERVACG